MESILDSKLCRKCGERKPCTQFSRAKRERDGLQERCKDCNRAYRIANQEKIRQQKADDRRKNRERDREKSRARYAKNAERNREEKRKYRADDPERARQSAWRSRQKHRKLINARKRIYAFHHREQAVTRNKAYRLANHEALVEYQKQYRKANYDHIYRGIRNWKRRNPIKVRVSHHRRRVRERGAGGNFTAAQWHALCVWFGDICLACGSQGALTIDHVVPLAKNGLNDISNLQPLCGHCNSSKQDKTTDYRDPARLQRFLETLS